MELTNRLVTIILMLISVSYLIRFDNIRISSWMFNTIFRNHIIFQGIWLVPESNSFIILDIQENTPQNNDHSIEDNHQPRKRRKILKPTYSWNKCKFQGNTDAETEPEPHRPFILHQWANEGLAPIDIFRILWNDELMELIKTETNRYHHIRFGKELNVTVEELYKALGIFLLSGYNTVSKHMLNVLKYTESKERYNVAAYDMLACAIWL